MDGSDIYFFFYTKLQCDRRDVYHSSIAIEAPCDDSEKEKAILQFCSEIILLYLFCCLIDNLNETI